MERGWLDQVSVRRPWRRRGVAHALIAAALRELSGRGLQRAVLGVDAHNPNGALGLYEGLDSWLAIAQNGNVTVFCGKVELGTGVTTGLSQIVAEELDVPVARIRMIMGDTAIVPDQGTTTGSKTTQMGGPQLRQAAAEARAVLNELAAAKLGASVDAIAFHDGFAFVKNDPTKKATLAELIGGKRFDRKMTKRVKGKAIADYTVVGQPIARVDLPAKIAGSFDYVHNLRLHGMLHGRVVRPPMLGAKLVRADAASVKKLGAQVVARGNFVGVVAAREETAIAAARQLKIEWELPADVTVNPDIHHELSKERLLWRVGRSGWPGWCCTPADSCRVGAWRGIGQDLLCRAQDWPAFAAGPLRRGGDRSERGGRPS